MRERINKEDILWIIFLVVSIICVGKNRLNAQDFRPLSKDSIFAYSLEEAMKAPEMVIGIFIYDHDIFPEEVLRLENVRRMGVVNCKFRAFPESISSLKKVELIEFAEMGYVPEGISKFPNIRSIMLPNTAILKIPEELRYMEKLNYLGFRYQDSVIFSKELRQVKGASFLIVSQSLISNSLCALPSLERVVIEGVKLDISTCFLNPLSLRELYIYNSTISGISIKPEEMNSLEKVQIQGSKIDKIIFEKLLLLSVSSLTLIDCNIDEALVRELDKEHKIGADVLRIQQKGFSWERKR